MKYKLLLVTVTYKPKVPELYEFIDSFEKYNDLGEAAKLVVVDNSPASFWNVSVARRKYPFVDFYENPSNPGFGAANNIGFGLFESEYVLFMNNDAEFTEPVFNKCIALFEENQQLGCLGIGQVGSLSFFYRSESPLKKKELKRRLKAGLFDPYNFFLSGAFLMLRSSAFVKVGMFDPEFFMYCEESDLINRLMRSGYDVQHIPTMSFLHKVGNRKKVNEYLSGTVLSRSYCYYLKKYNYVNHKQLFFSRYVRYYKRIIYFLLMFNFCEVAKIIRIIKTSTRIYKEYFPDVRN